MKPSRFAYHRPETIDETVELLAEHGSDAKVLAGGQSLLPLLNTRLVAPEHVIDINRVQALAGVSKDDGGFRIGATARQREVEYDQALRKDCPLLSLSLKHVAHTIIRNRGTVVGSLAHADPAAELPAVFALLGGHVKLASRSGVRQVPLRDFYRGYFQTEAAPEELVIEAWVPSEPSGRVSFREVSRRHGDFALCAAAAFIGQDSARLALVGVSGAPHVVDVTTEWRAGDIGAAVETAVADIEPTADIHASVAFRKRLARTLSRRVLLDIQEVD